MKGRPSLTHSWLRSCAVAGALLAAAGCGSSSSSNGMPPGAAGTARVRFAEGAPELVATINGLPQCIGTSYLQMDGQTVNSSFAYGTLTQFTLVPPGTHELTVLDDLGYRVGPIKTAALSAGKNYTLVITGIGASTCNPPKLPTYSVITFEEPPNSNEAQLSLYEASPKVPKADFGSFDASSNAHYTKLGSATLGNVVTVTVGKSVTNFGGYAGTGVQPFYGGTVTPVQVDGFDTQNALPFQRAARLSLFLFDAKTGSCPCGPVLGSLDR